jgi:hypothetical protein
LTKEDLKALMARIAGATDSITGEQVEAMRAEVRAFEAVTPIGYAAAVKAWNANEVLGAFEVTS